MQRRRASCCCGALSVTCAGKPSRVSACHCLACQKRTGSALSVQARWPADKVTFAGEARVWARTADSGATVLYHFCPECGSTVWYVTESADDSVAVPVGLFTDPAFPAPTRSVYEARRHEWVEIAGEVEHHD